MRLSVQLAKDELEENIFKVVLVGYYVQKQATGDVLASLMVYWETHDGGSSLKDMKTVLLMML